jgi:hypothetical protein
MDKNDVTNDDSNDEWDKDDFEPINPVTLSTLSTLTNLQISAVNYSNDRNNRNDSVDTIQEQSSIKVLPTIDEVEVKYPSGNTAKVDLIAKRNHSGGKLSTRIRTIGEFEQLKRENPEISESKITDIAKTQAAELVQGSSKIISKIELINNTIDTIDNITKLTDYIKYSQNWSRPVFQNEILGHIKKKDKFNYSGFIFSIKNTLHKLNEINQYFLTQRRPSDKIAINTKKIKCDDLCYTLYKIIIYIIYNSIRFKPINYLLNTYDIFEILTLIKLLKMNDDITLKYINRI